MNGDEHAIINAASSVACNYAGFRQASDLFDVAYANGEAKLCGRVWTEQTAFEVLARSHRVLMGELDHLLDCFPTWRRDFSERATGHLLTLIPRDSTAPAPCPTCGCIAAPNHSCAGGA